MATLRFLHTDFWRDNFFMGLTPEEKYFYIYLLTNDRCTQCGIYNLCIKLSAVELGYSEDTVSTLVKRFVEYGKVLFDEKSGEVMIINWYKYNMNINNKNTRICINTCLKKVRTTEFLRTFYTLCCDEYSNDMSLINEIFNEVSLAGAKNSRSIIEKYKDDIIDNSKWIKEDHVEKNEEDIFQNEEVLEETVDKTYESGVLCEFNVDNSVNNFKNCGKLEFIEGTESKIIEVFQNNFHPITPIELEKLRDWSREVSEEVVIKAIEVATLSNKRTMVYLNGILRNWFENGVRCIGDYERLSKENEEIRAKDKKKKEVRPPQYRVIPRDKYEDEEEF